MEEKVPLMTRKDRLRRVALLCAHFTRNLAYYRAAQHRITRSSPEFWRTVYSNFLDIAVLEWCKLFADRSGKHTWEKVLTDPASFKADLLRILAISGDELAAYIEKMRNYRDKFLAHLDDLPVMDIPFLDRAHAAVELYYQHITEHEVAIGDLSRLPSDLAAY
jgi:hypothetical protein